MSNDEAFGLAAPLTGDQLDDEAEMASLKANALEEWQNQLRDQGAVETVPPEIEVVRNPHYDTVLTDAAGEALYDHQGAAVRDKIKATLTVVGRAIPGGQKDQEPGLDT